MIVLKFGGTSLESAEAIERMESIVQSRVPRQPAVVVSALGKVTDGLLALGMDTAAGRWKEAAERFAWIRDYHFSVAEPLIRREDKQPLERFLEDHFSELQDLLDRLQSTGKFTPQAQAAMTSFGERLSSRIVTLALRKSGLATAHFDSRSLVRTDEQYIQAVPLLSETYSNVRKAMAPLQKGVVAVLGGFIGSTSEGVTTTLGRNSSNLTAVLIAAALGAEEVEIWTDVDGVFEHDPRQVGDQNPIDELSFEDALEMAHRGAKVLHPGAVLLARQHGLPMWIRNSRRPEAPGTRVAGGRALVGAAAMNGGVRQPVASSD